MKQFDVKAERKLNGNKFYVRPFPAFTATNLSGELASILTPMLASLAPLANSGASSLDDISLMDIDAEAAAPALAKGLSSISGDKVEALMKKLLTKYRCITVELEDGSDAQTLTEDLANEVFCGEAQDMFILAWDVIRVNFNGFFQKINARFGGLIAGLMKK